MKLKKYTRFAYLSLALLSSLAFLSCRDDIRLADDADGNLPGDIDGYALGFTISVDKNISTRANSDILSLNDIQKYDDYIDTQDKFRVFFFTESGEFLFGAIDRTVTSVTGSSDIGGQSAWYVRIPMTMIVDRKGNEFPIDDIKNFLKQNKFKVAVLANWPNAGDKVNPGEFDDSDENSGLTNPSSTLKGNPNWGWEESVLNPDARAAGKVKNINDLHHVFDDNIYQGEASTFGMFMGKDESGAEKKTMGEPTDWVRMKSVEEGWKASSYTGGDDLNKAYSINTAVPDFDSRETANAWIRANWNPSVSINEAKQIYRHYQHLWYLWNFDASYKYGLWKNRTPQEEEQNIYPRYEKAYEKNFGWDNDTPAETVNPWGAEWYGRNGETFYNAMKTSLTGNTALADISISEINSADDGKPFFRFNRITGAKAVKRTNMTDIATGDHYTELYGIQLPARSKNVMAVETTPGVICFRPRTTGTLRIKWSNVSATEEARLCIQRNNAIAKEYSISRGNETRLFEMGGTSNPNEQVYHLTIEDNSIPMYIYCSQGNAVIHSIEYIRGKYLFETDRENVTPNEDQGIPMYGVQLFNPVGDWEYGTTYDISAVNENESDQTIHNIKMIRALAKVVLYVPSAFSNNEQPPVHVYMRGMNRTARCEPIDVETPTDRLWYNVSNNSGVVNHGKVDGLDNCEFFSILKYGYDKLAANRQDSQKDWLKWFYGSWENAKWHSSTGNFESGNMHWNPGTQTGWTVGAPTDKGLQTWKGDENITDRFPHLFNPYINHNDFCEFQYAGMDDNGNFIYVIYLPDKNIADPSVIGDMASQPVVPHIEFRYSKDAGQYACSEFNLDDDDCYRIYFTNYGTEATTLQNPAISQVGKSGWNAYETTDNIGKYHWPIMRNHIYKFYLGSSPLTPTVKVKVLDWGHEKVVVEW